MDLHYFNELFPIDQYQDDFGHSEEWNKEIEKWLAFANSFDSDWYIANKLRVNREKQRDEFLGECKALYYIGEKLGNKIIRMEPDGRDNCKLDFLFEDMARNSWYVEVKSPSWRSVESKKIDNKFPDSKLQQKEAKQERWTQPQHIKGGGGSVSEKDAIKDAIRKASDQFLKTKNNMLIITPNMIEGSLAIALSEQFEGAPIHECIKECDAEQIISCVCILDTTLHSGNTEIEYDKVFVKTKISTIAPIFTPDPHA